jgi:hypothetical protein
VQWPCKMGEFTGCNRSVRYIIYLLYRSVIPFSVCGSMRHGENGMRISGKLHHGSSLARVGGVTGSGRVMIIGERCKRVLYL